MIGVGAVFNHLECLVTDDHVVTSLETILGHVCNGLLGSLHRRCSVSVHAYSVGRRALVILVGLAAFGAGFFIGIVVFPASGRVKVKRSFSISDEASLGWSGATLVVLSWLTALPSLLPSPPTQAVSAAIPIAATTKVRIFFIINKLYIVTSLVIIFACFTAQALHAVPQATGKKANQLYNEKQNHLLSSDLG